MRTDGDAALAAKQERDACLRLQVRACVVREALLSRQQRRSSAHVIGEACGGGGSRECNRRDEFNSERSEEEEEDGSPVTAGRAATASCGAKVPPSDRR